MPRITSHKKTRTFGTTFNLHNSIDLHDPVKTEVLPLLAPLVSEIQAYGRHNLRCKYLNFHGSKASQSSSDAKRNLNNVFNVNLTKIGS